MIAIEGLLTLCSTRRAEGLRAWTQAALLACELAEQDGEPLWRALPEVLESAGWLPEASSQQSVALPQLASLLRADPVLVSLLDRRGGLPIPEEASALLDGWWQSSLAGASEDKLSLLVATLSEEEFQPVRAQLYALTLPAPSWRWLVRAHLLHARVQRLGLKLDRSRHAPLAPTLAERNRARQGLVRRVTLEFLARGEASRPGLSP